MNILVLGGTGAMGAPLVEKLVDLGHDVSVTSRRKRDSYGNLHYIQGNAHDLDFLKKLVSSNFDVIVDFMFWLEDEFNDRINLFLESTKQYIFLSSSRVYAQSELALTEDSPRLLDVCKDEDYLCTKEYALEKARVENLLYSCGKENWTIVRPYITYNSYRMQLGCYEKEHWLYRALQGKTIVLPKDIMQQTTTLTYGGDVADVMIELMNNKQALGQAFHIVTEENARWEHILTFYENILQRHVGIKPKVLFVENSSNLGLIWNSAQIVYDRLYNRTFSNEKIISLCGTKNFKTLEEGLEESLVHFLQNPSWNSINWKFEAWADKQAKEYTDIRRIPGKRSKLSYLKNRFF